MAIRAANICIVSDIDGQRARFDKYFEKFYMTNPPSWELPTAELQIANADPPTDFTASSVNEVK